MKPIIVTLLFTFSVFNTFICLAQPGDLTHPAQKNNREVYVTKYFNPGKGNPLLIYDGVNLDASSVKMLAPATIRKDGVKISKDSIFDINHHLKYHGLVQIETTDEVNLSLKYIREKTDNWIYKNPLAVFYLNGKPLLDDAEKLDKLKELQVSSISEVRVLTPQEANLKFGKIGENGVIEIVTN